MKLTIASAPKPKMVAIIAYHICVLDLSLPDIIENAAQAIAQIERDGKITRVSLV